MAHVRSKSVLVSMAILSLLVGVLGVAPRAEADDVDGLHLEGSANVETVVSGEPFLLEAAFVNEIEDAGESRILVFFPEHVGAIAFPRWRFVADDGSRYAPYTPAFQSQWRRGIQGEIVELRTGGVRRVSTHVHTVVRVDADKKAGSDAMALPPGRYKVTCAYEKPDNEVPYGGDAFQVKRRLLEGLWTGTVTAKPFTLTVAASDKPVLVIDAPGLASAESGYPIVIRLRNLSTKAMELSGVIDLSVGMKGRVSGYARFMIEDRRLVPERGTHLQALHLDPGASFEATLDLYATSFAARLNSADPRPTRGFAEFAHDGLFSLLVRFEDADGNLVAASQLYRRAATPEILPPGKAPLALALEPVETTSTTPVVDVVLRNTSTRAVRVPATLAYPENVYFAITVPKSSKRPVHRISMPGGLEPFADSPEPGSEARLSGDMAWDAEAFEPRRNWNAASTVLLAPGSEIRRRVALAELVENGALLEWTTEVTAYYRNLEPGVRLGLSHMFVGLIRSEPLVIEGRGS